MAENSAIAWTDHTHNPWIGCEHASPGCDHCYAEEWANRFQQVEWGSGNPRKHVSEATWRKPFKWDQECFKEGRRDRVFSLSLGDWLDPEVDPLWLANFLGVIARTPNLDWLLLTKRIERWEERLKAAEKVTQDEEVGSLIFRWLEGMPPENVWLGATVENQPMAEKRIPVLQGIPARVRFISVEPQLEPINIWPYIKTFQSDEGTCGYEPYQLDWVICGGESGRNARPFNLEWARSLKAQAESIGASFFMKQCGENCWDGDRRWYCKGAGTKLEDLPEDLRIRQIPSLVTHSR